jgi:hypothetical protein
VKHQLFSHSIRSGVQRLSTVQGCELDYVNAQGDGGQLISLVPELDLMMVFSSWDRQETADIAGPLMTIYQADLDDQ